MLSLIYLLTIAYAFVSNTDALSGIFVLGRRHFWVWCTLLLCLLSITTIEAKYADVNIYTVIFDAVTKDTSSFLEAKSSVDVTLVWYWLCKITYFLGLNYRGTQLVVIIISMLLLHRYVHTFVADERIFWGLFLIFPALLQIIQLRYFLGTSIAVYSYGFLLKEESSRKYVVKNIFKFLCGITIAGLVHSSCFWFIILLAKYLVKNKSVKSTIFISIASLFVLEVASKALPSIIAKFATEEKYGQYFGNMMRPAAWSDYVVILLLFFSVVLFSALSIRWLSQNCEEKAILLDNFSALTIQICSLVLLEYNVNFYRFIEIGLIFGLSVIGEYFAKSNFKEKMWWKIIILITLIVFGRRMLFHWIPLENLQSSFFTYYGFSNIFR